MDDISIFTDKANEPNKAELSNHIGTDLVIWQQIEDFVLKNYPAGKGEWNYPGKKYGWSYRIKDKKRAIIYFLPREGSFKVAFVFGEKAISQIIKSDISESIKQELLAARKYAEGRGIRITANETNLVDIKKLVEIKLNN